MFLLRDCVHIDNGIFRLYTNIASIYYVTFFLPSAVSVLF